MSIIVDGYNYIGHSREFELSDPGACNKLTYLIGQYCSRVHKSATIVFDGNYFVDHANRKRSYGRVTVIYTAPMYSADEMIKKMVSNQPQKHRKALTVVSSDEEILTYSTTHGASAVRSEEFERTIEQALTAAPEIDRTNLHVSSEEVQQWLKIFEERQSDQKSVKHAPRAVKISEHLRERRLVEASEILKKEQSRMSKDQMTSKRRARKRDNKVETEAEEETQRMNIHLSREEVQEWLDIFQKKK